MRAEGKGSEFRVQRFRVEGFAWIEKLLADSS